MTADKSGRTSAGILLWRRRDDRLEVLDECGITHRFDTGDVVHLR